MKVDIVKVQRGRVTMNNNANDFPEGSESMGSYRYGEREMHNVKNLSHNSEPILESHIGANSK